MLDLLDEARRPEQRDPGFAPAAEVVHMGVADENRVNGAQGALGQVQYLPAVEQQAAAGGSDPHQQ